MELINMMAMNAALPQGVFDASIAPLLLGLVGVVFAIGSLIALSPRRTDATPRRQLTLAARPAFGVAR